EFKRRAHTDLQPHQVPAEGNAGEWLALMQHFGAPTRLLDVTQSPYVAAYFALEDAVDGVEQCAVWAVNKRWCLESAGEAVLKAQPERRAGVEPAMKEGVVPKGLAPALAQGLDSSTLVA